MHLESQMRRLAVLYAARMYVMTIDKFWKPVHIFVCLVSTWKPIKTFEARNKTKTGLKTINANVRRVFQSFFQLQ